MKIYCPKLSFPTVTKRQVAVDGFMMEFTKYVRPWFTELVSTYKEYGEFDVYPTVIADYYPDRRDKVVALMSTLCMDWKKESILQQVHSMIAIMGSHPYEWFKSREFVMMSIGRDQDNTLDGGGAAYWKMARLFDRLYEMCKRKRTFSLGMVFPPRKTTDGKSRLERFASSFLEEVEYDTGWEFKTNVIELVLRTSDGLGRGLWKNSKSGEKCPRRSEIYAFMKVWVSDYSRTWDFKQCVGWFGLEHEHDFFYLWMAWKRLVQLRPKECSKFSNVFVNRYNDRLMVVKWKWMDYLPKIDFDENVSL